MKVRPPRLAASFNQGEVADAFLAAQVEWLCNRAGIVPARWSLDPRCVLEQPWFLLPDRRLRMHLLLDTPDEFRNRDVFTTPEVTITIHRGRPRVDESGKREKARLRQKRYRERLATR